MVQAELFKLTQTHGKKGKGTGGSGEKGKGTGGSGEKTKKAKVKDTAATGRMHAAAIQPPLSSPLLSTQSRVLPGCSESHRQQSATDMARTAATVHHGAAYGGGRVVTAAPGAGRKAGGVEHHGGEGNSQPMSYEEKKHLSLGINKLTGTCIPCPY